MRNEFDDFDWERESVEASVAMVRRGTADQINSLGRFYNWDYSPIEVLSAVLEHPGCDLGTALTIFVLGEPRSYESLAASKPTNCHYVRMFEFLKSVHDRINSGRYRIRRNNGADGTVRRRAKHYLAGVDTSSIFQLDRAIVEEALTIRSQADRDAELYSAGERVRARRFFENLLSAVKTR